jgi:hypothetical protein
MAMNRTLGWAASRGTADRQTRAKGRRKRMMRREDKKGDKGKRRTAELSGRVEAWVALFAE